MPKPSDTWMWDRAQELLEEAERLQKTFFQLSPPGRKPGWEPPVDVFETPGEFWILVALPGVDAESLEVRLVDGTVVVSGVRTLPGALRRAAVHRLEIPHGRFERRIELPSKKVKLGASELVHGCLALSLAKTDGGER